MPTSDQIQDQIQDQLTRIESSGAFQRSMRMRQFLRYLITQDLAHPGERISPYNIGREVFRRSDDFDPNEDPVVRVEAVRLRKLLAHYYAEHPDAPVNISIPKGQYTPAYAVTDSSQSATKTSAPEEGIGIMLLPIDSTDQESPWLLGLSSEILTQISRVGELRLVSGSGIADSDSGDIYDRALREFDCNYVLQGTLIAGAGMGTLYMQLLESQSRKVLWSDSFDLGQEPENISDAINRISDEVTRKLATPAGVVILDQLFQRLNRPGPSWDAVDCMMRWHSYRLINRSSERRETLMQRTAELVEQNRGWAMGRIMLAYLWLDGWMYRKDPNLSKQEALDRCRFLANQAKNRDHYNPMSYYLFGLADYFDGNVDSFEAYIKQALSYCPAHTDILQHGGALLWSAGRTEVGEAYIARADMRYQSSMSYRQYFLLRAYLNDEIDEMHALLSSADRNVNWYLPHLYKAVCEFRRGDVETATAAMEAAFELAPSLRTELSEELDKWIQLPALRDKLQKDFTQLGFANSLRAAG